MTPKEWHLEALSCARRALFEYQVANQAMYDMRKALQNREHRDGAEATERIIEFVYKVPTMLRDLVNYLERDPILDEPKDLHSAGDCDE